MAKMTPSDLVSSLLVKTGGALQTQSQEFSDAIFGMLKASMHI